MRTTLAILHPGGVPTSRTMFHQNIIRGGDSLNISRIEQLKAETIARCKRRN
jgi:hypothetical protein